MLGSERELGKGNLHFRGFQVKLKKDDEQTGPGQVKRKRIPN